MSIDLENEDLVPISQAARHIPGRPHLSCIYRWMNRKDAPLESVRVGGRRWTSRQAISRFIASCNSSERATPAVVNKQREARAAAVDAALDREGI